MKQIRKDKKIITSIEKLKYGKNGHPLIQDTAERMRAAIDLSLAKIQDNGLKQKAEDALWIAIFNDDNEKVIKHAYKALGIKESRLDDIPFNDLMKGI